MRKRLSIKFVKARKPHNCFGCANEHPKGTYMYRFSQLDCEMVWTCHLCEVCHEYEERYLGRFDNYGYGDLYKGDPKSWEELRQEMLSEENGKWMTI